MVVVITYIIDTKINYLVKMGTLFDSTAHLPGFYIENTPNGKTKYLL